ncbi:MAG: low molecular weight protein-tyrosine-phosphatase [Pseudomonadota bacterium]
MTSVLFVCLGNICRSPAAHGSFLKLLADAGLNSQVRVDSAGTGDWHIGAPPDERMTAAAAERGIDLNPLRARQVTPTDFDDFEHVFAMDVRNLEDMQALAIGRANQPRLYLDLVFPGQRREVPDPYFGGAQGFEEVLDLVEAANQALLRQILG